MIGCNIKGGLGNMLFQIATTHALAMRNNDEGMYDLHRHSTTIRPQRAANDYKTNIFRKVNDVRYNRPINYQYDDFKYKNISYNSNLNIDGYFQCEKYFVDKRKEVLDLFEPSEQIKEYIEKKYGDLSDCVSVHVRRGDYVRLQHVHPLSPPEYYQNALSMFKDKKKVIFSDDMNWCKQAFKLNNQVFSDSEQDFIDLYIMSMCGHNIICNSSFSWWGAWLNQNPEKKVIAPKQWFTGNMYKGYEDIYCDWWQVL